MSARPLTVGELIAALQEQPDYWTTQIMSVGVTTGQNGCTVILDASAHSKWSR